MNCLEFRRQKLADPRRLTAGAEAHARTCAACRDFAAGVDDNEARLAQALLVPVPDGMADRVILQRKTSARRPSRLIALAASVVLTLGVGTLWWKDFASPDYARLAIEHVMHEPESFTTVRLADPEMFRAVLHNFGGEMHTSIGRIRYMKLCPVPEGTAWHIVFETEHGLATLILVPDRKRPTRAEQATLAGWHAVAEPAGQGYYAVITDSADTLAATDRMIRQRVRWRG